VECYTFRVDYHDDEQQPQLQLEMKGQGQGQGQGVKRFNLTYAEVRKQLQFMLRHLLMITQMLKTLPENRYLVMKLLYHDDHTPQDYEPPGFKPYKGASFTFSQIPEHLDMGHVQTPHHRVNLKIQTITDTLENDSTLASTFTPPVWNVETEQLIQKNEVEVEVAPHDGLSDASIKEQAACATQPLTLEEQQQQQHDSQEKNIDILESQNSDILSEFIDTQLLSPCHVNAPSWTVTKEESSGSVKNALSAPDASRVEPTQHQESKKHKPREVDRLLDALTPVGILKMPRKVKQPVKEKVVPTLKEEDNDTLLVHCDCGVHETDEGMILCEGCQRWGHCYCYGYTSTEDPRLPSNHYCYDCQCSVLKQEKRLIAVSKEEFTKHALWRRVLAIAWKEGVPAKYKLVHRLGVSSPQTRSLMERLWREGFMEGNPPGPGRHGGGLRQVVKNVKNTSKYEDYMTPKEVCTNISKKRLESATPCSQSNELESLPVHGWVSPSIGRPSSGKISISDFLVRDTSLSRMKEPPLVYGRLGKRAFEAGKALEQNQRKRSSTFTALKLGWPKHL